jgi:uncharacterized protein
VAEELVNAFTRIASGWNAKAAAFLYLPEQEQAALTDALRRRGYLAATLAAGSQLQIRWPSFAGYIASLAPDRRRRFRHEQRAFAAAGLGVCVVDGSRLRGLVDQLAPLYAEVERKYGDDPGLDGAAATLGWILDRFADRARAVVAWDGERAVAFHLFLEAGDLIHSYVGGQPQDRPARTSFLGFNVVYYETIRWAIDHGVRCIDYGIQASEVKAWRGCALQPLSCLFDLDGCDPDNLGRLLGLLDAAQRRRLARLGDRRRRDPASTLSGA